MRAFYLLLDRVISPWFTYFGIVQQGGSNVLRTDSSFFQNTGVRCAYRGFAGCSHRLPACHHSALLSWYRVSQKSHGYRT